MLYSCKPLFSRIKAELKKEIETFPDAPRVCIITTGEDEPSLRYVRNKMRDFEELGIDSEVFQFDSAEEITNFLLLISAAGGKRFDYDGIIVQRPILTPDMTPKEANAMVSNYLPRERDIDGVVPGSGFMPPSVRGLDILLQEWGYDPAGKTAVVIGRGDVGRPVVEYLLSRDATVTVCHSKTPTNAREWYMCQSDIVVGAAGLSEPIYPFAHPGGVVIDYGITKGPDGKLHGDISPDYSEWQKFQTPVPGGMGLMVRAGLLMNIAYAYKRRRGLE